MNSGDIDCQREISLFNSEASATRRRRENKTRLSRQKYISVPDRQANWHGNPPETGRDVDGGRERRNGYREKIEQARQAYYTAFGQLDLASSVLGRSDVTYAELAEAVRRLLFACTRKHTHRHRRSVRYSLSLISKRRITATLLHKQIIFHTKLEAFCRYRQ